LADHLHTPITPACPACLQTNRLIVLALTFLCYTAYHASRKPPSIVKSVLHGDASANGGGPALPPAGPVTCPHALRGCCCYPCCVWLRYKRAAALAGLQTAAFH
jgi:hypothetical protein